MNSSSSTRTGKVGRLPHSIRHQLNLRIQDNLPAKFILPWLNSLPEVKTILAEQFDSRPITKQNLSDWTKGGFRDWLTRQHALQCAQNLESNEAPAQPLLPANFNEKLAQWLTLQYAAATRSFPAENPRAQWNRLREFCADISRLRRADFHSELLQIKRDWLAHEKTNAKHLKETQFTEWAKARGILREPVEKGGLTEEDMYEVRLALGLETFEYPPEAAERIAVEMALWDRERKAALAARQNDPSPTSKTGLDFLRSRPLPPVQNSTELEPATPSANGEPSPAPATANPSPGSASEPTPAPGTEPASRPNDAPVPVLSSSPSTPVQPSPSQSSLIQPKNQEGGSLDTTDPSLIEIFNFQFSMFNY